MIVLFIITNGLVGIKMRMMQYLISMISTADVLSRRVTDLKDPDQLVPNPITSDQRLLNRVPVKVICF